MFQLYQFKTFRVTSTNHPRATGILMTRTLLPGVIEYQRTSNRYAEVDKQSIKTWMEAPYLAANDKVERTERKRQGNGEARYQAQDYGAGL